MPRKEDSDLTLVYMLGYHDRDEEVWKLQRELETTKEELNGKLEKEHVTRAIAALARVSQIEATHSESSALNWRESHRRFLKLKDALDE
jgi:hypothetical protein